MGKFLCTSVLTIRTKPPGFSFCGRYNTKLCGAHNLTFFGTQLEFEEYFSFVNERYNDDNYAKFHEQSAEAAKEITHLFASHFPGELSEVIAFRIRVRA